MDYSHLNSKNIWIYCFLQVVILSVPGFLMNCAFLGWITYKINKYNWSWDDSMLFGIILSTTDPILSVASVKNLGE